jgi:opacity protein-like surface antigen
MARRRTAHSLSSRLTPSGLQVIGFALTPLLAFALALAAPAAALDIPVGDQYKLTFYGFLNPAVTWDSRGSKGVDWAFASPNSDQEDSAFGINIRNSRLGLEFAPKPEAGIAVGGKAEVDFVDSEDTSGGFPESIRIRHMYATLDLWGVSFLIGQTWTFLHQIEPATVNTTNLFGQGHIYDRIPQVRVSKTFGDFRVALQALTQSEGLGDLVGPGAGGSSISSDQPNWQGEVHYRVPDGPLKGALVGVGGSVGSVRVKTPISKESVTSWAAGLELYLPYALGPYTLSLGAKGWVGEGAGYGTAAAQFAVVDAAGRPEGIGSIGGYLDLGVARGRWALHAIVGIDDPEDTVQGVSVDRRQNWTVIANVTYALTKWLDVGLEYQHVETKYSPTLSDNSVDLNDRVLTSVFLKW